MKLQTMYQILSSNITASLFTMQCVYIVIFCILFFFSTYDADAVLLAAGITTVSNDEAVKGAFLPITSISILYENLQSKWYEYVLVGCCSRHNFILLPNQGKPHKNANIIGLYTVITIDLSYNDVKRGFAMLHGV